MSGGVGNGGRGGGGRHGGSGGRSRQPASRYVNLHSPIALYPHQFCVSLSYWRNEKISIEEKYKEYKLRVESELAEARENAKEATEFLNDGKMQKDLDARVFEANSLKEQLKEANDAVDRLQTELSGAKEAEYKRGLDEGKAKFTSSEEYHEVGAHSNDASPAHESESSKIGRRNSEIASVEGVARKFSGMSTFDHGHGPHSATREVGDISDHGHGPRFATREVGDISDHGHGPRSAIREVGDISPNFGSSKSAQNDHVSEYRTPKPYLPSVRDQGYATAFPSLSSHSGSSATSIEIVQSGDAKEENRTPSYFSCTPPVDVTRKENKAFLKTGFEGFKRALALIAVFIKLVKVASAALNLRLGSASQEREIQSGKSASEKTSGNMEFENSESFDICEERNRNVVKLKAPLLATNRAKRHEAKRLRKRDNIKILRPGMILLKGYLPLIDQVKLVKSCRNLGRGSGGFYQPGYHDGATLHLKMMCLGKNWDPLTSSYGDERPIDGAKPPPIPNEFQRFVKEAIQDCHDFLESHSKVKNAKDILPSMSPNICIINFYSKTGKFGLHQDKDESQESLKKGLPVVSFSIGDSAEFLYGDRRDIEKADKVVLESGDVLIFGGKSRNIFHGVTSIVPDTAPKALLEETDLRPGRLNLTFKEY
ncbi:hypothetical protein BUALT_Bualt07G0168000 [Buddleja alternifolia]|uniref:DNA N(6)-methyladenine demethylase n=1 Tax=Buddleja alternifolia TaxID=168488 RepID=A0AAV6XCD3_9LAMI|nr:hypothetical protein BUALT_Bualt07G0168000 [Buddleja alternifolia]